jgi:hypothetical protein
MTVLESVRSVLPANFLNCHKSYSVNMDHIRIFNDSRVILTNGAEVPVSRARFATAAVCISVTPGSRPVGKLIYALHVYLQIRHFQCPFLNETTGITGTQVKLKIISICPLFHAMSAASSAMQTVVKQRHI